MRIVHRAREAVDILICSGAKAGESAAQALRERIAALVRLGEPIVIVDLAGIGAFDPVFVDEIVACRSRVLDADGTIKLVVDPRHRATFAHLGSGRAFDLYPDQTVAMESFAPETATYGIP